MSRFVSNARILALLAGVVILAGCQRNVLLVKRSQCPAVAVPTYTGDMTLFAAGAGRDARDIDVVATITELRSNCLESDASLNADITYKVIARRTAVAGARSVTLPVFATVVQGGNLLVSKQLGQVTVNFADGQARASADAGARAMVARSVATLPSAIQDKINRKRKAGDLDAATDPLSDPAVKAAIRAASFEVLIGFQLDDAALAYNVTK